MVCGPCDLSVRCSCPNAIGSWFGLEGLLGKGAWDLTVIDQEKSESMVVDALGRVSIIMQWFNALWIFIWCGFEVSQLVL